MKLSLWILLDWLAPFNPLPQISSGQPVLRGARHFSDGVQIERQNVYIGRETDFFPSGGKGIICAQGNDFIRLATDDYEAVFNSILRAFDYYNSWSDNLREQVLAGCSLQELADNSADIFVDPFFIQDSSYRIAALSQNYGPGSLDADWDDIVASHSMRMDRIAGINNLIIPLMKAEEPFVFDRGYFPYRSICQNIFLNKKHVGWFVLLEHNHPITEGRKQLCDTFNSIIEYWMTQNENKQTMQASTALFLDLIDGKAVNRDQLARCLETMGWHLNDDYCVIKVVGCDHSATDLTYLAEPIERSLYGCVTILVGLSLLIIVNLRLRRITDIEHELMDWMIKSYSCCGISHPFTDIMLLPQYYEQSDIAISCGSQVPGQINKLSDYALAYALNILKREPQETIAHRALSLLKRYDREHGTDFFNTLRLLIINERNQVKTAEQLFLHRNSLAYRINRILEITGLNLDDPDTRLHVLLSYSLYK